MRSLVLVFSLLSFSAFAAYGDSPALGAESIFAESAAQKLRNSLNGTWHSSVKQNDAGFKDEYLTVADDGTFRLRIITTDKAGLVTDAYAIVGIWGVAEDILFTTNMTYEYQNDVVYPAYLGDAHEFNAYRILELDESFLHYRILGKDSSSKLKKLDVDPCDTSAGFKLACAVQERISEPEGLNSGSSISLAE